VSTQYSIPGPPEPPGPGRPDFMGGGPPEPPRPGIGVDLRNLAILLMLVAVIIGVFRQCHSKGTEDKTVPAPQESSKSTPQESSKSTPQESSKSTSQESSGSTPQESSKSTPQQSPASTPQENPASTSQERSTSTPQEQPLSRETQQSKHGASCLTAAQRMDKNGVLPRDYSINCPYWQWWAHKPTPPRTAVQPSPDPPHSPAQSQPDSPRTRILPDPDPPQTQVPPETAPPRMHMFSDPQSTRREREALRYRRERDWCGCPF
jgi:hypothetical protein